MKHKLISDKVFRSEVIFYAGCSGDDALRQAKKKYKLITDTQIFNGYAGTCLELFDKESGVTLWFIWVKDRNDWKTMCHETSHLIFRILDKRGVKYNSGNDETWCYLHEYFMSEFWHVMCG